MHLFTTYFNFLRNHKSLGYKPPIMLDHSKVNIICLRDGYDYDIEQDMQF